VADPVIALVDVPEGVHPVRDQIYISEKRAFECEKHGRCSGESYSLTGQRPDNHMKAPQEVQEAIAILCAYPDNTPIRRLFHGLGNGKLTQLDRHYGNYGQTLLELRTHAATTPIKALGHRVLCRLRRGNRRRLDPGEGPDV